MGPIHADPMLETSKLEICNNLCNLVSRTISLKRPPFSLPIFGTFHNFWMLDFVCYVYFVQI